MIRSKTLLTWFKLSATVFLLAGCASTTRTNDETWLSREGVMLNQWVDSDLTPYLKKTLGEHPRFRGESVLVVSMDGNRRRTPADQLSNSLVRRISESVLDAGGVNLVWDQNKGRSTCAANTQIHYYIGVDIVALSNGKYRVSVRALDLEDNRFVGGFGRQWQGSLNRSQRSAYKKYPSQRAETGTRGKPFAENEADLLAKQLAVSLARKFCGRVGEPLRIMPIANNKSPMIVAKAVALVGNYLAESHNLDIVEEPARANAFLSGRLVTIDKNLHQLWLQLRPADSADDIQALNLQAYLHITDQRATRYADTRHSEPRQIEPRNIEQGPRYEQPGLMAAIRVVTPTDRRRCRSTRPWHRGARVAYGAEVVEVDSCFALEIETSRDAHVFLMAHNSDARLVRLLPNSCDRFGRVSSFVRQGRTLRFPSQRNGRRHVFTAKSGNDFEDFYVFAVADRGAAETVRNRIRETNDFCGGPATSRNSAQRLHRLEKLIDSLGPDASWHRIQVVPGLASTSPEI